MQGAKYIESENKDEPTWAPLRDSFSLTNSKLKDWDKMPVSAKSSDSCLIFNWGLGSLKVPCLTC